MERLKWDKGGGYDTIETRMEGAVGWECRALYIKSGVRVGGIAPPWRRELLVSGGPLGLRSSSYKFASSCVTSETF